MAEKKIMTLTSQQHYDEKIKAYLAEKDTAALAAAKKYADDLSDNYDAAGTATTKVAELANGAVKANTDAINKLNGTGDGSVAKAVSDAKALVDADVDALEAKVNKNTSDIDTLNADVGDVESLTTTAKNLSGAIEELKTAIGTGGTASVVTLSKKAAPGNYAAVYELKQGTSVIGTIDIPKDMVVQSGEVVKDPAGMAAGTYIKLTLANVDEPLFINVGTLVDIYKAKASATQVQITIDSATREISASVVAGSIGSAELADNAVVTAKIADGNVTKAKLVASVQASLDKADTAENNAKAYSDKLNTDMDTRVKAVEAALGEGDGSVEDKIATAKTEAISAATTAAATDATTKANNALKDAKAYTDEKVATVQASTDANTTAINGLKTRMTAAENDIDSLEARAAALETKIGDGFAEITVEEIDAMFAAN